MSFSFKHVLLVVFPVRNGTTTLSVSTGKDLGLFNPLFFSSLISNQQIPFLLPITEFIQNLPISHTSPASPWFKSPSSLPSILEYPPTCSSCF